MPDTSIVVEFQNTLYYHIHAVRVYDSHQLQAKINKVVAVLLALFGAWAVYTIGLHWWTIIWFIVVPVEWFDLLSIRPLQIRLQFRVNPKYRETYHLEFSDSGIHFMTPTIDSHIAWTHYNRVIESDRVFILVYGRMMYSMIPKSAFTSKDEIDAFRELLYRHIS